MADEEELPPNPDKFMATDMTLLYDPRKAARETAEADYARGVEDKMGNLPPKQEASADYYRGWNDTAKTHPKERRRKSKKVAVHIHRS